MGLFLGEVVGALRQGVAGRALQREHAGGGLRQRAGGAGCLDSRRPLQCGDGGVLAPALRRPARDGAAVLLRALNGLQAARYLEITEANKTQRRFLFGWIKERVAM